MHAPRAETASTATSTGTERVLLERPVVAEGDRSARGLDRSGWFGGSLRSAACANTGRSRARWSCTPYGPRRFRRCTGRCFRIYFCFCTCFTQHRAERRRGRALECRHPPHHIAARRTAQPGHAAHDDGVRVRETPADAVLVPGARVRFLAERDGGGLVVSRIELVGR
ncbi:hypothetical protein Aave_1808 [Paracidovorax citrulli AAC00-1]|uniref:Uncharacterized protein n=1 Tax=Paracidovorax citrulli (strain AAC00-1) TaxID=397945 RepID=A1TN55_PARC0|nr:hypothetical protein Aave_1808 [Paracidovorax citrulli AAC00-1]